MRGEHHANNQQEFLSTLSLRRATPLISMPKPGKVKISIHALLAESDMIRQPNPTRNNKFLSTLSLRRATIYCHYKHLLLKISIHALLAESDRNFGMLRRCLRKFLSTLSLRRATLYINRAAKTIVFLSTLSLRRATPYNLMIHRTK